MTVVTRHPAGTFCWAELATTDQPAATAFYTALFGWIAHESPMGEGETYTMLHRGDQGAAALYAMNPRNSPPGVPPHWLVYLAVDDADATAAKVGANGGIVLAAPFDVMAFGRMAVCQDPLGATFAIWQPKTHVGVGVVQEPGALTWCQLNASDPGEAAIFYQGVFGWAHRRDPMPQGGDYVTYMLGDQRVGGGMPIPKGVDAPAHWLLYFGSADVDATAARARQLGGQWLVAPTDIPGTGRFAVLADPQGAAFATVKFGN